MPTIAPRAEAATPICRGEALPWLGASGYRFAMNAEHLRTAAAMDGKIHSIVRRCRGLDPNDIRAELFTGMIDDMPAFKRLMDTLPQAEMDELCLRFPFFYYYAKILEATALGISTGAIEVPPAK